MKKTLGIVCEYNPFHNGHFYHLEQSKKELNCENSIAIISGNFTQRGECAICDKWARTKMALQNGIDLVIELPTIYSTSSSENYAYGAIEILNSLGIVDYISFGSEAGKLKPLKDIANILYQESDNYKKELSSALNSGVSFPTAREIALKNLNIDTKVLAEPNNSLGIEYLKALLKTNSTIKPYTIKRNLVKHSSIKPIDNYASASLIREKIEADNFNAISKFIPESSFNILKDKYENGEIVSSLNLFEKEIIYILRNMKIDEIVNIPDVSEGLEFLIKDASNKTNNLEELIHLIKSKRYTRTRIQRILTYCLLGINKKDMQLSKDINNLYIRVLGMNKNGEELLKTISKTCPLPIITSVKKAISNNYNNRFLLMDINATNVYTLGFLNNSYGNLDFTKKIEKI